MNSLLKKRRRIACFNCSTILHKACLYKHWRLSKPFLQLQLGFSHYWVFLLRT
ncbi:hypothetical protein LINPERPRIM_LOCUS30525 [Linum perenne]